MIKNLRFREVLIGLVLIAFFNMTLWMGLRKPSLSKRYMYRPEHRDTRRQGQNNTAEPQQSNNTRDDPPRETGNRDTRRQGQKITEHQQSNNTRDDPPRETDNRDTRRQGQNITEHQQSNHSKDNSSQETASKIRTQQTSHTDPVQLDPQTPKLILPTTLSKTGLLQRLPLINLVDLKDKKPNVLIVILVLTSVLRYDRRQMIRNTWWTKCKDPATAVCMFVTDGYIDDRLSKGVLKEKKTYNDMLFLPVDEGLNFGLRLFWMMKWAHANYKPKFFLRMDDDYFICIERLLNELPQRPKKNVVWGHWHCDGATTTFIDESFMLLSFDLVETFLSWNESSLLCHPFGDQQLGIWMNRLPAINAFFDSRLHHNPPASRTSKFSNMANICDEYIGLHGTYPNEMKKFWLVANDGKKRLTEWISLYPKACHNPASYTWQHMGSPYRHEPKLCNTNPRWTTKREMWKGRQ